MKLKVIFGLFALLVFSLVITKSSWPQVHGIEGTWYFGEKPLSLTIYDSGWRFTVTDEEGNKSHGKAFNEDVIYLPSENISGQIEIKGTIIEWSDGTYWSRQAFTGDTPPNLPEGERY